MRQLVLPPEKSRCPNRVGVTHYYRQPGFANPIAVGAQTVVSMEGIVKRFGELKALDGVSLELRKGEVHALLGENGAGKTTLMNVLYGLYRANEGRIVIDGTEVSVRNPKDALAHGVGMVHQHFSLIPNFTAFENIIVGTGKGLKFDQARLKLQVTKKAQEYGLTFDIEAVVKSMAVGAQQRVEILKVLVRDPQVLILDEPTSSLTPQESDTLLSAIKRLAQDGLTVVFITHKVKEVMAIATRITILKRGHNVGTHQKAEITEPGLVKLMMDSGKESHPALLAGERGRSQAGSGQREPALEVQKLVVFGDQKVQAVNGLDLTLYRGEILGMAGVSGNGQRELAEAITGVRRAASGEISVRGQRSLGLSPKKVESLGVSYIPEDRMADGLLPTMSVAENLILGHHRESPFAKALAFDSAEIAKVSVGAVHDYDVKTPGISTHAAQLSGGNIQKVLIARALLTPSRVLVAHNPTRGLDIATTDLVLRKLRDLRDSGAGILLISEDLDELMLVSDRICVISKGRITGTLLPSEYDRYKIGALMTGGSTAETGTR